MAYTYDLSTTIGLVRLEIQDTDEDHVILQDAEINALITAEGSDVLKSAARCCEVIARKYAQDFNWQADGDSVDRVARARQYREMAAELRKRAGGIVVRQTVNRDGAQPIGGELNHEERSLGGFTVFRGEEA